MGLKQLVWANGSLFPAGTRGECGSVHLMLGGESLSPEVEWHHWNGSVALIILSQRPIEWKLPAARILHRNIQRNLCFQGQKGGQQRSPEPCPDGSRVLLLPPRGASQQ